MIEICHSAVSEHLSGFVLSPYIGYLQNMTLVLPFLAQKNLMSVFSAKLPAFCLVLQRCTQQVLVNSFPNLNQVSFFSFGGASTRVILIFWPILEVLKDHKKRGRAINQAADLTFERAKLILLFIGVFTASGNLPCFHR